MYFDAVLDADSYPIFNGTPEEVKNWLVQERGNGTDVQKWSVCLGSTLTTTSVDNYINNA